jgi:DNA-binding response OmpR family regulator
VSVGYVLVASDTTLVSENISAAVREAGLEVAEASTGQAVIAAAHADPPDLVVVDLQMGSMGGMAICMDLHLDESWGKIAHIPVLMLLDRRADVFLARRCAAEGWLIKPLDAVRVRRAVTTLLEGGAFHDDSYQPLPIRTAPPVRAADAIAH